MRKPMIGAQLYTLRDFCKTLDDTAQTLERVKAMGYDCVQLSRVGPMDDDPEGLARVLDASGLKATSTHISLDAILADPAREIARHQAWGVKHAALGSCPLRYPLTLAGLRDFSADFAKAAASLAAAGIDLSYHNHRFEFVRMEDGRSFLRGLYESLPPSVLKAELDVAWVACAGGSPARWIRDLGPRQPLLHLKDFGHVPAAPGEPEKRNQTEGRSMAVGSGNLDWPDILAAAEEVGVEYAFVEIDFAYGGDMFAEMEKSRKFLASLGY